METFLCWRVWWDARALDIFWSCMMLWEWYIWRALNVTLVSSWSIVQSLVFWPATKEICVHEIISTIPFTWSSLHLYVPCVIHPFPNSISSVRPQVYGNRPCQDSGFWRRVHHIRSASPSCTERHEYRPSPRSQERPWGSETLRPQNQVRVFCE